MRQLGNCKILYMQKQKFNIVLDAAWGSSGKGKIATYLAHRDNISHVSSANFPNAGHSAVIGDYKFVAKAIPTAACLKKVYGTGISCFISSGSGFEWGRLIQEWDESGRPLIFIHDRSSIVDATHKLREETGKDSTKHIASTMQGTATALCDKILRKQDCKLARNTEPNWSSLKTLNDPDTTLEFVEKVHVIPSHEFRNMTHNLINEGHTWLHEGSQGYALSIDHGSHYPNCTSRNCSVQLAMDYMAIPPKMVGDVYLNFRTFPIRVGNVIENGVEQGYSGDFAPDCEELTWEQVADRAGMPDEEKRILAERERTTVTKRIRRVSTFSFDSVLDAVRTNGATKLSMNFIQYINWQDNGLRGGKEAFLKLSKESRSFIARVEEAANIPVVLIGTGAKHDEIIDLE